MQELAVPTALTPKPHQSWTAPFLPLFHIFSPVNFSLNTPTFQVQSNNKKNDVFLQILNGRSEPEQNKNILGGRWGSS